MKKVIVLVILAVLLFWAGFSLYGQKRGSLLIVGDTFVKIGSAVVSKQEVAKILFPYEKDAAENVEGLASQLDFINTITYKGGVILVTRIESLSGAHNSSGIMVAYDLKTKILTPIAPFVISLGPQNNKFIVSSDSKFIAVETLNTVNVGCAYSSITISRMFDVSDPIKNAVDLLAPGYATDSPVLEYIFPNAQDASWNDARLSFKQSLVKCNGGNVIRPEETWQYNLNTNEYNPIVPPAGA